jgi:hypothetical protein
MHAGQEACYLPTWPIDFDSWKRNPVWRDYFAAKSPNASYGEPRRMGSERVFTE